MAKIFRNEETGPATFVKNKLQRRCFPMKFVKFLRAPILKKNWKRLLLEILTKSFHFSKEEIFKTKSFAFSFTMRFNDRCPDGFKNEEPFYSKMILNLKKSQQLLLMSLWYNDLVNRRKTKYLCFSQRDDCSRELPSVWGYSVCF